MTHSQTQVPDPPTTVHGTNQERRPRRRSRTLRKMLAVVAMASVFTVGFAEAASADVYESRGGSMASAVQCFPAFGTRGILAHVAMSPSTAFNGGQWVTARLLIRRRGTTGRWISGPWAPYAIASGSKPASMWAAVDTDSLSPNHNVYWDVHIQGAWYANGSWRIRTATAARSLPSGWNTATPYWQHPVPRAVVSSVNPYRAAYCLS